MNFDYGINLNKNDIRKMDRSNNVSQQTYIHSSDSLPLNPFQQNIPNLHTTKRAILKLEKSTD